MIKDFIKQLPSNAMAADRWVAILTWAMVSGACLYFLAQRSDSPLFSGAWTVSAITFLLFIIAFHIATRDKPLFREPYLRIALLVFQFLLIVVLYALVPYNFVAILMVMWAAQLPYYLPLNKAVALSPLAALPHFLMYHFYWQDSYAWLSSVLFWTFIVFSIVMMGTQLREVKAREQAQAVNRELRATQALLAEASKQSERSRIARNIHDLLGHHLTALTINLQVAERQSSGDAQRHIEKSRSIAQLLLADVREAVAELRDGTNIDIRKALEQLHSDIPGKQIDIGCEPDVNIQRVDIAEAIIFSVQETLTNFLKHSSGNRYSALVTQAAGSTRVTISDNGMIDDAPRYGNGLRGLAERVGAAGGQWQYKTEQGFSVTITFEEESSQ